MNAKEALVYLESFCESWKSWSPAKICEHFEYLDGAMSSGGGEQSEDFDGPMISRLYEQYCDNLKKWPHLHEAIVVTKYDMDFESIILSFEGIDQVSSHSKVILNHIYSQEDRGETDLDLISSEWKDMKGGSIFTKCLLTFEQFRWFVVEESAPEKIEYRRFVKENSTVINLFRFPKLFEQTHKYHELWGDFNKSPMKSLKKDIQNAGRYNSHVLITGETGTGKELCAKSIFKEWVSNDKDRFNKEMVIINAASYEKDRLEADLFGYVKGAFTGADKDKDGFVSLANNSILFIDELGEMPKEIQAKLLRFVESGEYYKLGSTKIENSKIKIIGGTNNPGGIKHDLIARLGKRIHLEPLRERIHDLPILISALLPQIRKKEGINNDFTRSQLEQLFKFLYSKMKTENVLKENVRELQRWLIIGLEKSPPMPSKKGYKPEPEEIIAGYELINKKNALAKALGTTRPTLDKCINEYQIQLKD